MGNFHDLTGQTFGLLTVIETCGKYERNGNYFWLCRCICGKLIKVVSSELVAASETKSCGCYHEDLIGKKFGKLTVMGFLGKIKENISNYFWECVCECGRKRDVTGSELKRGKVTSCGKCVQGTNSGGPVDLTGKVFGRWTVLYLCEKRRGTSVMWHCVCSCPNKTEKDVAGDSLKNGRSKSCGCYSMEVKRARFTTHGQSYTLEYNRAKRSRRREQEKIYNSEWTTDMEIALTEFFGECVICGSTDRLQTDHVYPLNKKNKLLPGNSVKLCIRCNGGKGERVPEHLPPKFPKDAGRKLKKAAKAFKKYWDSIQV